MWPIVILVCSTITVHAKNDEVITFYANEDENSKPTISLSFIGHVYKDRPTIKSLEKKGRKLIASETFISDLIEANKTKSQNEVLMLWNPQERKKVKKLIFDQTLFSKNRNYYSMVKETRFLARIQYGKYLLFYVEHSISNIGPQQKLYPLVKVGEQYYSSNGLTSDFFFKNLAFGLRQYFKK